MKENGLRDREELFARAPVARAIYAFAVPTVLGQLVTLVYSLTDTYFVGQMNDPTQVAAVSLCFPLFHIINALANLYGIGGGSLISRLLGSGEREQIGKGSAFACYAAAATALLYSILTALFMPQLMRLSGAKEDTLELCCNYMRWTGVIGGVPTMMGLMMSHILRGEGRSREAGNGMMIGGIANIILDPLFIYTFKLRLEGAAIATMLSNVITCLYYLYVFIKIRKDTALSFAPRDVSLDRKIVGPIFSVGAPSAILVILSCAANMVFNDRLSAYGSTALAAAGIAKKLDTLPLNVTLGLCQGTLPLIAYNYAAKNTKRMTSISNCSLLIGIGFSALCIVVYECLPRFLIGLFIDDLPTVDMGVGFLRIMILSTPMITVNLYVNSFFQGLGKAKPSILLSSCRQGLFYIPMLFALDAAFGMFGVISAQLASDTLTMLLSLFLFFQTQRQMKEVV